MHPGTAHVVFHPPIDPAGFTNREDLTQAVRQAIASGLPPWMRT
jgi:1-acyl-sn-glycerol-3-phosphate acyltransferase